MVIVFYLNSKCQHMLLKTQAFEDQLIKLSFGSGTQHWYLFSFHCNCSIQLLIFLFLAEIYWEYSQVCLHLGTAILSASIKKMVKIRARKQEVFSIEPRGGEGKKNLGLYFVFPFKLRFGCILHHETKQHPVIIKIYK